MKLTTQETSDLNTFIFDTLRHQFGKQVDEDWCLNFTQRVVSQANHIQQESDANEFAARNAKIVELTERN